MPFVVKLVDNYGNPLINQTVVFTIHGVSYNKITDNDGNAKMNIRLNNGVYTIGFAFKGTSKYKSTSGTRTVSMISGMLNPNLDANVVNKYYGDSTPLKIYLKDNNYQPLTNKEITIRINGVTYTKTTDNNGYASMGISLYAGSYSAIIQFPGDTYYYGVTLNIPVTINKRTTSLVANDLTKYYNSDDKFFVRLLSDGNPLTNKVVKMTINGVAYDKITDNKGYVYSNVNLNPGTYQANVVFNGDNYYSSSSISKTLVVKEWLTTTLSANNLVKYYGDADSFNVKLTSENNVLTGKNINFNVNGVNYVKTTNNEGYAKLNISLLAGTYTVVVSYNGELPYKSSSITKTITINKKTTSLIANDLIKYSSENDTFNVRLVSDNIDLKDKIVKITINGVTYNKVTNGDGYIFMNIRLNPGSYCADVLFEGDDCYKSSSVSKNILIKDPSSFTNNYLPIFNVNSGFYNKSWMLINISCLNPNATIYCSFNNSAEYVGTQSMSFNLTSGNWTIKAHTMVHGVNSTFVVHNYLLDGNAPFVYANYGSGIYENPITVNLIAIDDNDKNPIIYYTLDGTTPTINSMRYTHSFVVSKNTKLRFMSIDKYNHKSSVFCVNYFFGETIVNINTAKTYDKLQNALNDPDTQVGDIIEISKNINEKIVLNKTVCLRSCDFKNISWRGDGYCIWFQKGSSNSIVDGFKFLTNSQEYGSIIMQDTYNCLISNNKFYGDNYAAITSKNNCSFNNIINNEFYGSAMSQIFNNQNVNNYYILDNFISNENIDGWNIYSSSMNNSIIKGNMICNAKIGIYISNGFNNSLSYNNITNTDAGVFIGTSNYYNIISNIIQDNAFGIYLEDISNNLNINFNIISHNYDFNFYNNMECNRINVTYNWWGSNNFDSISQYLHCTNNVDYSNFKPFLYLYTSISSYKSHNGLITGATICVDLTIVWDGVSSSYLDYSSNLGCIPDGLIAKFNGVDVELHNGKAYYNVTFNSSSSRDVNICVDGVYSQISVEKESFARIVINSSAVEHDTNNSFHYEFNVPLNDSVDWISVVWKYKDDFESEINLIVNGEITKKFYVDSSFYNLVKHEYRSIVFDAVKLYNKLSNDNLYKYIGEYYVWISLKYNVHTLSAVERIYDSLEGDEFTTDMLNVMLKEHKTSVSNVLLSLLKNSYGLFDNEINFIKYNFFRFPDTISLDIKYFGDESRYFNFDNGYSKFYNWVGDNTRRYGAITYLDGSYAHEVGNDSLKYYDTWKTTHYKNGTMNWNYKYAYGYYTEAGYDGLMTFTFANTRITDNILRYYLNQKNKTYKNGSLVYSNGFMKAAYGSFMEGLLVIYCNDLVADASAARFNVSWDRTSPMVMSVRDDVYQTILSGECSFNFGRTVKGDEDNVRAFNFACSASFSPIEHYVGKTLFPNWNDNTSATVGLGYILEHGGSLEIIRDGFYTLIRENNRDDRVLVYDSQTGILQDSIMGSYGSYCYSNQQAEWACDLAEEILDNSNTVKEYLDGSSNDLDGLSEPLINLLKCSWLMEKFGDLILGEAWNSFINVATKIVEGTPLGCLVDLLSSIVATATSMTFEDYVKMYVSDPKFWAGIAGGILFDVGAIVTATGIGLPLGLGLMGAGTLFTAYSCGLFDFDKNGKYVGATDENLICFGFSMLFNVVGAGALANTVFKSFGKGSAKLIVKNNNRVITRNFNGGYYRTVLHQSIKYVQTDNPKKPIKSVTRYVIDEKFGKTNLDKIRKISEIYKDGVIGDIIWRGTWNYLDSEGVV